MKRLFVVEDERGLLGPLGPSAAEDGNPYAWSRWKRVWPIDLDDMLTSKPEPTDEQRYQFLEARSQRDAAEAAKKLSAQGKGMPVVCGDDREKMREVIEAMRPIVEAALHWSRRVAKIAPVYPQDARDLVVAVNGNRDRLAAAMSAWADSQTVSEAEKLRAKCAAMEKVVEAAMTWVSLWDPRDVIRDEPSDRELVAALDAYRKQVPR